MAGRNQKKAKYQSWECIDGKYGFARISKDMQKSNAFRDLSKKQTDLYLFAINEQYTGTKKPCKDYPDLGFENNDFYLNIALVKADGLYTDRTTKNFYNDIKSLIEHGFIECVSSGKTNHKKSIYRYSGRWKTWEKPSGF